MIEAIAIEMEIDVNEEILEEIGEGGAEVEEEMEKATCSQDEPKWIEDFVRYVNESKVGRMVGGVVQAYIGKEKREGYMPEKLVSISLTSADIKGY